MTRNASAPLTLVATAALLAVLASPAVAVGAQGDQPSQDSVAGSVSSAMFVAEGSIEVRSGPSGEDPSGTFSFESATRMSGEHFVSSSISCVAVSGSTAVVGGFGVLGTDTTGPQGQVVHTVRDTGFIVVVRDNGSPLPPPPGSPAIMVDDFNYGYVAKPDCAAPGITPVRWSFGDFTVIDAPSTPTSKAQCKHGAWRRYGTAFRDQGQCVASVERGPKP